MEAPLPSDSSDAPTIPAWPLQDPALEELVAKCEIMLEYRFRDHSLLKEALTHASIADDRRLSNERLEFLGDSVTRAS